jgi:hypothetical protein
VEGNDVVEILLRVDAVVAAVREAETRDAHD